MKKWAWAVALSMAGCSRQPEFPPETVAAYQADDGLRAKTLQACGEHAANHTPFATQSDADECQKAAAAQGNVNFAAHDKREREGNARAMQGINSLTGDSPADKH